MRGLSSAFHFEARHHLSRLKAAFIALSRRSLGDHFLQKMADRTTARRFNPYQSENSAFPIAEAETL